MIQKELFRFLIAGFTAAGVDFLAYHALVLGFGLVSMAKACGFVAGTLVSYLASKYWTFGHREYRRGSVARFLPVYALSLGINVGTNAATLQLTDGFYYAIPASFVAAAGLSAAFNFVALKFFVFHGPVR